MGQLRRDNSTIPWSWFFIFVLLLFMEHQSCLSIVGDTLSSGQSLSGNQTIISQGGIFELGFFTTGDSRSIYLGIWYKYAYGAKVWVANRDKPFFLQVNQAPAKLEFYKDGNLVLLHASETIWSTNLISPPLDSIEAVLLDSGNFVLRDSSRPSTIFWQSFDHPTDTWLPGAKLGLDKHTGKTQVLTSWRNSEDPTPGRFSFGIDPDGSNQYFLVWNMSKQYWSSGAWNGTTFSSFPHEMIRLNYIFNYSFVSNANESYLMYSLYNDSMLLRFVMDISGQIKQYTWMSETCQWLVFWALPRGVSEVYAFCGPFGVVGLSFSSCSCLQGFEPFSIEDTSRNDWSGGCVRKTPLQCENITSANGKKDGFLKISNMTLPTTNSKAYPAGSAKLCELACMQNCSCTAYAYNGSGCSIWEGALLNLQLSEDNIKQDLYLKLAASELQNAGGNRKKLWVIVTVPLFLVVLVSGFLICCLCFQKLKHTGEKTSSQDLLLYDFNASINETDKTNTVNNLRNGEMKDVELPMFSFASVSTITDNFSAANKLGEGGYGPVYKGKSLRGQEIAVKRLSKRSGQGIEEFRNETVLIAKLQHRNLVRLLGCCIEQDENILIYEYMPNKSLDFFLFDPKKQELLDWGTRICIIEGIAQGLLYLHQYSRLRIIHRDLKASNILLDSEMNPKISDFGMARIFGGNESQANTHRIVGTYGYMAPEYAMEGIFSVKSDVFSFGVLLLEIVSGKKNTGFYHTDAVNLLGYAWELWNTDRGLDLMDPILGYPSSLSTLLRYINIGLLCVQENPNDRPTMSDVVSMLGNELVPLPTPKQPAFSTSRGVANTNSSQSSAGNCSVNIVTLSLIEAR